MNNLLAESFNLAADTPDIIAQKKHKRPELIRLAPKIFIQRIPEAVQLNRLVATLSRLNYAKNVLGINDIPIYAVIPSYDELTVPASAYDPMKNILLSPCGSHPVKKYYIKIFKGFRIARNDKDGILISAKQRAHTYALDREDYLAGLFEFLTVRGCHYAISNPS